jgi:4-amino-4-deoxy-L-arabinose transferase-like glycosyltransferase
MGMVGWTVPAGGVVAAAGESYLLPRLLAMATLAVTGWAAFRLARDAGLRAGPALAASLTVSFCPVLFWLSTTFMTDAPWHMLWTLSLWLTARGLRTGSGPAFAAGAAAAAWAAWIRVPAAAIPLAAVAAVFLARTTPSLRRRAALASAAVLMLGVGGFMLWYRFVHGETGAFRAKSEADPGAMLRFLPGGVFACVAYAGFFLAPLAPIAIAGAGRWRRGALVAAAIVLVVAAIQAKTGFLPGVHKTMPYLPNVAFNLGLGPLTVTDVLREGGAPPVTVPGWTQLIAGAAAAAAGAALLWIAGARLVATARRRDDPTVLFLGLAAVLYLGAAVLFTKPSAPLFDRYLVPMIAPIAIVLLAPRSDDTNAVPRRSATPGILTGVLLALFAAFALLGTRDYHRFAAARAELIDAALAAGGTTRTIDGGFEFNCGHNYEAAGRGEFVPSKAWKGWLVGDPVLVVSTRGRAGYDVVARRPVRSTLTFSTWDLLLLRRRDG